MREVKAYILSNGEIVIDKEEAVIKQKKLSLKYNLESFASSMSLNEVESEEFIKAICHEPGEVINMLNAYFDIK